MFSSISCSLERVFARVFRIPGMYLNVFIKPDTVLPKYSKIQVLPGITSCRLMKYNKQAIELNSLLMNDMPKDGYG